MNKLRIAAAVLVASALCGCGGSPAAKAGREAVSAALAGVAGVKTFRKTRGESFVHLEIKGYRMSFEATAVVLLDQAGLQAMPDAGQETLDLLSKLGQLSGLCGGPPARGATATLKGVVTFMKTDSGWTVYEIRSP
jgi:hypothetical protein